MRGVWLTCQSNVDALGSGLGYEESLATVALKAATGAKGGSRTVILHLLPSSAKLPRERPFRKPGTTFPVLKPKQTLGFAIVPSHRERHLVFTKLCTRVDNEVLQFTKRSKYVFFRKSNMANLS